MRQWAARIKAIQIWGAMCKEKLKKRGDMLCGSERNGYKVKFWPGDLALSCNPSYLGGQSCAEWLEAECPQQESEGL
jgi:hypothetical protein